MKITAIYAQGVGPLMNESISLMNDWANEVEQKVLFTGPNGCGKSTLLRAVAHLWDAAGYWLDRRQIMPKDHPAKQWLSQQSGIAVIFDGIQPFLDHPVGLFYGSVDFWLKMARDDHPDVYWLGENITADLKAMENGLHLPNGPAAVGFEKWSEHRRKLLMSHSKVDGPNVIYLDAEARRWVTPTQNVAEPLPDQLTQRWLTQYIVSDQWQGQLEASLITLKTTQLHRFHDVTRHLNQFLRGKEIDPNIKPGEGRLRIKLKNQRGVSHLMDELSAGEHQMLILIYLISRWLQPGGIVLIDEPDMFLHPSLVKPLLATIEQFVAEKDGQLIITSHAVDVWQRYENHGLRYELTADGDHHNECG